MYMGILMYMLTFLTSIFLLSIIIYYISIYYLPIVAALGIVVGVVMPVEEIASSQPLLPPLRLLQLDSGKPAEMKKV